MATLDKGTGHASDGTEQNCVKFHAATLKIEPFKTYCLFLEFSSEDFQTEADHGYLRPRAQNCGQGGGFCTSLLQMS